MTLANCLFVLNRILSSQKRAVFSGPALIGECQTRQLLTIEAGQCSCVEHGDGCAGERGSRQGCRKIFSPVIVCLDLVFNSPRYRFRIFFRTVSSVSIHRREQPLVCSLVITTRTE